jgi:hypothetical protein
MEPRRRPLRTYSKRTSSESSEPAPKRRCVSSPDTIVSKDSGKPLVPSKPELNASHLSVALPSSTPTVNRGTITAYFQRSAPPQRAATPPVEPSSEPTEPNTTPPSSPPITSTRKRVRRLKARVTTHRIADKEPEDEDTEDTENEHRTRKLPVHQILSETKPSTLNLSAKTPEGKTTPERKGSTERGKKERKKACVQTTLSLTMSDTAYTECKECDMLYNCLDKTDVRHHARHHAAKLKAKASTDVRNEIDD